MLSFQQAAYFIRDWRALHLVSYSPFLAALPMLCLMQESPRWLLATGQVERATEAIARVARANGRTSNVSKNMDIAVAEDDTGEKVKKYAQEHTVQYKILMHINSEGFCHVWPATSAPKQMPAASPSWHLVPVALSGPMLLWTPLCLCHLAYWRSACELHICSIG